MGTSSSTPQQTLSPHQRDIQYLGDRMPFGDEELYHIYKAYQQLLKQPQSEKLSFLTDMGVLCVPPEEREQVMVLLQAVEKTILPPGFGNRMYEQCFLRSNDPSEYSRDNVQKPPETVDEYTRMAKLEAFFEGLSNGTRRGGKKTLQVFLACCQPHPAPPEDNVTAATPDFAYGGANATPKTLIDPLEFVTMGYRVALASAFLSSTEHSKDEHQDLSRFLPDEKDDSAHVGLVALANSLVDLATKRRQRQQPASSDQEPLKLVEEEDVQEWAEHVAPLFASSLATFLHIVFFPNKPYPPTRTSFDYPDLSGFESAFFSQGNSPLLFSFGCMSSALSGEVSTNYRQGSVNCVVLCLLTYLVCFDVVLSIVHIGFGWFVL